MAAREAGKMDVDAEDSVDGPRLTDFTSPYFFFSSCIDLEIRAASPSIRSILGYDAVSLTGVRLPELYFSDSPLNADDPGYGNLGATHGQSFHWLRSVLTRRGDARVLSIMTVGVTGSSNRSLERLHSIAEDVTTSVTNYCRMITSLREMSEAENRLTKQESHVAGRIRQGQTNREIADELNVSERTVDRRRARIMNRLNVSSTPEMIARLVERTALERCIASMRENHWQRAWNAHRLIDATIQ
ncbi:MAG: helix-turn-helix transcriptional regulator [Planctomycetales bacterium]|nr:helix-turn-helix transcriptional regulator [Planctomycetales bacterium]